MPSITYVPNQPATPVHCIRCPDEVWEAARDKARERNETITDVIIRALKSYAREWG